MGITVTDIITEYGAYYEKGKQNTKRVLKLLSQKTETEAIMTPIKTDDTVYKLANASVTSILQPFQKGWTPKGNWKVVPNPIYQHQFKVDEEIYPDDIVATWLGFLEGNDLDRSKWPLVRYITEGYYIPMIHEEYELAEVFKGVAAAPTPGSAGDAGTGMDGLRKKIIDGILVGNGHGGFINQINVGALSADTIFDQVEEFVDKITERYQGIPMEVCMSKKWRKAYLRDKRAQNFINSNKLDESIDFSPQKVKGLASMNGSDILFASPKSNMIALSKKSAGMNKFKIETAKRQVFFFTDFWKAVGFGINEAVWASVPDAELSGSSSS